MLVFLFLIILCNFKPFQIKEKVMCQLDVAKLKGFYDACAHILGYQTSDSTTPLRETLQISVKEGHNVSNNFCFIPV